MISMIAAMTPERVIGRDGDMPWHLPADLAWFKRHTLQKPVVMGRKTWQSMGSKPLPERHNIIISRDQGFVAPGAALAASPAQALTLAGDAEEVMIIGGAQVYQYFLPQADRLYITLIHMSVVGDSCFPHYDHLHWQSSFLEERPADAENPFDCSFMILDRLH
ncbi:MAG: type 3 dihydrofolate reductase [Thiothrix nivea]|nr:MAG: type 3 dihydrofolate reductase [Thiothrix nivea]